MSYQSSWILDNLTCSGCKASIEDAVTSLDGVSKARFNSSNQRLEVVSKTPIDQSIVSTIKNIEPAISVKKADDKSHYYSFSGIDCPSCALDIEQKLSSVEGVESVYLDWGKKRMRITTKESENREFLDSLLAEAKRVEPTFKVSTIEKTSSIGAYFDLGRLLISALLFLTALLTSNSIFYYLSYLLSGYSVLYKAARNILHLKVFDEHFLMSIASIGALAIGESAEGSLVMLLYLIGEYLQDLAVSRRRFYQTIMK